MINYLFMTISIIFSVINACLLRAFSNQHKGKYSPFFFNAGVNLIWILILSILYCRSKTTYSLTSLAFGTVYGVLLFTFLFFKTQAMATGPVSLSTLIGSCAFLIASAFGIIYYGEKIHFVQIFGMILLLFALFLCVNPRRSKEPLSIRWFLYCFGFFLAGGLVGILYKLFGTSSARSEVDAMLLTASLVSTLLFFSFGLLQKKNKAATSLSKSTLLFMLLCGIASCLYIRMNVTLSNLIPSVIFFPVSNGGMVILSAIAGKILFKEKLSQIQTIGIITGCIAVVMIGCGETIYCHLML